MIFRANGAASLTIEKTDFQNGGVGITGALINWVAYCDTAGLSEILALSIAHPSTPSADTTDVFKGSAGFFKFDPPIPVRFRDANDEIVISHGGAAGTSHIIADVEGY